MKIFEPVIVPRSHQYIDPRFNNQPRIHHWQEAVPRLDAWLEGKRVLYLNGDTREYGFREGLITASLGGIIAALWLNGGTLWPWLLLTMLLFALPLRSLDSGFVAGFMLFGLSASCFYLTRLAAHYAELRPPVATLCGWVAVAVCVFAIHRSVSRYEPSPVADRLSQPVTRKVPEIPS
jgi:hypothetical protein